MSEPRQSFDISAHHLWGRCRVGQKVYISDMVRLRGDTRHVDIGAHAQLHDFAVLLADAPLHIGARSKIGYAAHVLAHGPVRICAGARIGGHAQLLAGYFGDGGWETGPIEIGTGAVIGPGAVIFPGTIIPEGACVAANEVLNAPGEPVV